MQQKLCCTYARLGSMLLVLLALSASIGCSPDKRERISAVYELKADPSPSNLEELRGLLADSDRDVRATALHALGSLRVDGAVDDARAALDDSDGLVRATATKLLAEIGSASDAPRLAARVREDPDPVVRRHAAAALSRLGGEGALAALAEALRDPAEDVRLAATSGLRGLDPTFAREELARLVLEDPSYEVRVQAAGALGETNDAAMRAALETALDDRNEFVRAAATHALDELRDAPPPPPTPSPSQVPSPAPSGAPPAQRPPG